MLKYKIVSFNLIYTTLLTFFIVSLVSFALFKGHYSIYVVFTFTTIIYAVFSAFYLLYFVLLYAVEYDEIPIEIEVRENAVLLPPISLDDESFNDLKETICTFSGKKCFDVLSHHYDLKSGAVYVNFSSNYLDIKAKRNYKYSTFINLERLNNIRGINNLFKVLNQKLPDGEWKSALAIMKKHQIVEYPGALRDLEDDTPIYIYSTINLYCSSALINELIEAYREENAEDEAGKEDIYTNFDE